MRNFFPNFVSELPTRRFAEIILRYNILIFLTHIIFLWYKQFLIVFMVPKFRIIYTVKNIFINNCLYVLLILLDKIHSILSINFIHFLV